MKFLTLKNNTKGFTLIEALVSLGIFSIVVVAASGVILSIISSNKKNQAISSVVNNLNYSIESMVRDIKTGYNYHCDLEYVIENPNEDYKLENFKLIQDSCSSSGGTNSITLISTISGKEQVVKYELGVNYVEVNGEGVEEKYIKKTVYVETGGVVTAQTYPLTDTKNIQVTGFSLNVISPTPLIPRGNGDPAQPYVSLIIKGTAKVNQINISDFFIQTFISQRLPNFI